MNISSENLLVILFVGLVAGWLAGQIVRGTALGSLATSLWGFWAPLSEVGYCLS
jgi:uncharacterized membrane protein YeaQ/YmgE (transglycosylase-associated protein family)